jgi:hypothetical protein
MSLTIFDSRDPAGRAALELSLLAVGLGTALQDAMESGRQAADEARERRAAYKFACELVEARGRADELGHIAIRAVKHVAALEGKVRRLRTALMQRQAYISRNRSVR